MTQIVIATVIMDLCAGKMETHAMVLAIYDMPLQKLLLFTTDIDECDWGPCLFDQVCVNTYGGYKCVCKPDTPCDAYNESKFIGSGGESYA